MSERSSTIPVRQFRSVLEFERRQSERFDCELDATARPCDLPASLFWGASVRNISRTGIGLTLCFPFCPGTQLFLELFDANKDRPVVVPSQVIVVRDQNNGSWLVGCH